ncbi:MAG: ribonuclease E inhibitor RraB [Bacteroidetes bacterium]|nr:ribonuclease E inhibitor RraB [Bacteroidota bacterium]
MKRKPPKLRNLKPRTPDAAVVALIKKMRPGFSKSCPVSFYFYFPAKDAAMKSTDELRNKGFEVEVALSAGSPQYLCLASKNMVPETTELVNLRESMVDLAFKYGGNYDGWEAAIDYDEDNRENEI